MISRYVWLDGRYVPTSKAVVPITTHAIHYGTSAFEGIRAYWNGKNLHVFRLDEHIARFRRSGTYYDMVLDRTDSEMRAAITGICRKNAIKKSCYIRPFYFVGEHGISLHVTKKAPIRTAVFVFPMGRLFEKTGISACVVSWKKFSDESTPVQAKMGGNYLNSIIATGEAKKAGADEAILLDYSGNVSEAPGENIFVVRNGRLFTPSLDSSALDGITRDTVTSIAGDLDIPVEERPVPRSEMMAADEIFLTGTAAEITPVTIVDGKKIGDGRPGDVTKKLVSEYADIVMGKNKGYMHWLTGVYT
ncbi:MAG: branched-chain amino acid transaminase [Nitrosopumilus sp. D6]|nr:MAG: branched-chain amino acid transaminase [Nitrosopumilus sp. D6]